MRAARERVVEAAANKIRTQFNVEKMPKINLEHILLGMNIKLISQDMDSAIYGAAIVSGNDLAITVKASDNESRKRFTIAHELGHLMLHRNRVLSFDAGEVVTFLRDDSSSTGTNLLEIEANHFAACLLMPKDLLLRESRKIAVLGEISEEGITKLANIFDVSKTAMSIRLGYLRIAA